MKRLSYAALVVIAMAMTLPLATEVSALASSGDAAPVSRVVAANISNIDLRRDVMGEWMDVHDGNIMTLVDPKSMAVTYLYYGIAYHNCTIQHSWFPPRWCPGIYEPFGQCGFRTDHMIRLYSSPDLVSWTLVSENVFPVASRPFGIYFRPKVVFNRKTQRYVLWVDFLPNASSPLAAYPKAELLVATSDTAEGPFTLLHSATGLGHSGPGDFTLMVLPAVSGEDDAAFVAYGAWSTEHTISIERLDDNFTNSLGLGNSSGLISPPGNEAPILFHRQGWIYLIFGECCCFCQEGAGASVYVASNPLGPWSPIQDVYRHENRSGLPPADLNPVDNRTADRIIASQNNFVFTIPSSSSTAEEVFVWMGDRWASADDQLFGHDLQSWHVLHFASSSSTESMANSTLPPYIEALTWEDWFIMNVTTRTTG